MFSTQSDIISPNVHIFDIISLFATEFDEPKMGVSGKGLSGKCMANPLTFENSILDY